MAIVILRVQRDEKVEVQVEDESIPNRKQLRVFTSQDWVELQLTDDQLLLIENAIHIHGQKKNAGQAAS